MKNKKRMIFAVIISTSAFLLTIVVIPTVMADGPKEPKDKAKWLTLDLAENMMRLYEEINGPDTYYIVKDDVKEMETSNGDILTRTCWVGEETIVATAYRGFFKVHSSGENPRLKIYIEYRFWEPMVVGCNQAVFVDPASYIVNFRYTDLFESGYGREEYYFDNEALNYKEALLQFLDNWRDEMVPAQPPEEEN